MYVYLIEFKLHEQTFYQFSLYFENVQLSIHQVK